jgi:uncharacterized protein (TIGR03437 family)
LDGVYGANPTGLIVDTAGNAILAGSTQSPDYPTTPGAFQPVYSPNPEYQVAGPSEAAPPDIGYITKLNSTGTALVWSTFLGGSGAAAGSFTAGDSILGMALDSAGNILVAGEANSPDFPGLWTTPVASRPAVDIDTTPPGFAARLTPDGATLSPVQPHPQSRSRSRRPHRRRHHCDPVTFPTLGRVHMIEDPADAAEVESVAPGQLLSLYGSNLAPEGVAPYANGYPTSFNGVTVTFNGIPAPLLYTAPNQINFEVPYEIAGQAQVTMAIASQIVSPAVSEQYYLAVAASRPSIFVGAAGFGGPLFDRWTCNGQTISGIQPLALNSDGTLNSCANRAAAGSTITVFLNGLGVTKPGANHRRHQPLRGGAYAGCLVCAACRASGHGGHYHARRRYRRRGPSTIPGAR